MLIQLLRMTAANYNATVNKAFRLYFDGSRLTQKTLDFLQLLNSYLYTSCKEYLTVHQQILDGNYKNLI